MLMKVCPNCGFENSDDDTYCRECGLSFEEDSNDDYDEDEELIMMGVFDR